VKLFKTYLVVMAAVAVAVIAVPVAQGGSPNAAALRALEIRGQGMNNLCADATLTQSGRRALCGATGAGSRPNAAALRALEIRGQGMNGLCPDSTLSVEASRALCGGEGAGSGLTAAQLRGFETRGQAMNRLCSTKHFASADAAVSVCGDASLVAAAPTVRPAVSSGFDWADFGIGAGAMLGLVLLAGGIAAGLHYGRSRSSVRPRPAS
jgi:hypothetical protein